MPTREFIITIKGGSLNGLEFKKYSQMECDNLVELMEKQYGLKFNIKINN